VGGADVVLSGAEGEAVPAAVEGDGGADVGEAVQDAKATADRARRRGKDLAGL
jgi:hypothetical protein